MTLSNTNCLGKQVRRRSTCRSKISQTLRLAQGRGSTKYRI